MKPGAHTDAGAGSIQSGGDVLGGYAVCPKQHGSPSQMRHRYVYTRQFRQRIPQKNAQCRFLFADCFRCHPAHEFNARTQPGYGRQRQGARLVPLRQIVSHAPGQGVQSIPALKQGVRSDSLAEQKHTDPHGTVQSFVTGNSKRVDLHLLHVDIQYAG